MKKKVYRELHKDDEVTLSINVAEPITFKVDDIIEKEPKKKTGRKKKND